VEIEGRTGEGGRRARGRVEAYVEGGGAERGMESRIQFHNRETEGLKGYALILDSEVGNSQG